METVIVMDLVIVCQKVDKKIIYRNYDTSLNWQKFPKPIFYIFYQISYVYDNRYGSLFNNGLMQG